jgi:proline iminopeptidase
MFLRLLLVVALCTSLFAADHKIEDGWIKTHDGYQLYFQKIGNGPQKVIVPLRVFTIAALKELASDQRTLIFYDTRNRGKSQSIADATAITLQNDVRDLESVRSHFKIKKFTPMGYSYAGMMVVLYATEFPQYIDRIVQFGPVPHTFGAKYSADYENSNDTSWRTEAELAELRALREQGLEQKDPKAFCLKYNAVSSRRNVYKAKSDGSGEVCEFPNEWPVNFQKHLEAHFVGSVQNFKFPVDQLKKVTMPVLTIHGKKDRNAPYGAGREWAAILPDARLLTLDEAAHAVWADEPKITLAALKTFLDGKWPDQAERITKNPALAEPK